MKKRKSFNCIVGLLSAAILFTSEGMSCLSVAAASEDQILPPPLTIEDAESGSEDPSEEKLTLSENSEDEEVSGQETPNPEEEPSPSDDQNIGGEDAKEPETPEELENPDDAKEPTETEEPDADTISDNSVSINDLMSLEPSQEAEEPPVMTDFEIVDEGGNPLDETKILYILENSYRQLHVKLTPEGAAPGEVKWSSENARILVTDGKVTLKPAETEASDGGVVAGIVSAQIGELTKTCKVEFQPLMKEITIVDQNGVPVPESGIAILPGQQKKLGVKIQPEGAVLEDQRTIFSLDKTTYLKIDQTRGVLSVRKTPEEFSQEATVTVEVRNTKTGQEVSATCKVTIPAPSESDGIRCGDILFYCDGMQPDYKKSDTEPNTWEISANRSNCTLTYVGTEDPNMEYAIFYSTSSRGIDTNNLSRPGTQYRKSFTYSNDKYPLQFVLGTKPKNDPRNRNYTLSDVYTIRGTLTRYRSDLRISPGIIRTIPGAPDQEIKVTRLPDTCEMKDVTWVSGDERLVRIKEKTENGVMLQFGQSVGTTQITAIAKDYRGRSAMPPAMSD